MSSPTDSEIYSRVEAFAAEIVAVVRASAVEIVEEALGGSISFHGGRVVRSVRRSGSGSGRALARQKGAKRDPKDIAALTEKLSAFIQKNPGKRIEEIGKALGVGTKELVLPVKKLIAAKSVSTKGQKRATTYFAR